MEGDRVCPNCGHLIQRGQAECPQCRAASQRWPRKGETVLLLSLVTLGALFTITGLAVKGYHAHQEALANEWYEKGQAALRLGQAGQAVVDFRTALVYSRDNDLDQLHLAEALMAADRLDEARAYLEDLRQRKPESAPVNLQLGRLAARQGDVSEALRYFHSAIYGDWQGGDPNEMRRSARLELYQFLISRGAKSEAQAELMALAANLPADARLHTQVGDLFLESHDNNRALQEFQEALRLDRSDPAALAGAGMAEFELANYREAQAYLERSMRRNSASAGAAQLLATTQLVLGIDPYEPRLTAAERSRRVVRAFRQAFTRIQSCAAKRGEALAPSQDQTALQSLYARALKMHPKMRESVLNRDPDLITAAMDWVNEAEGLATSYCGQPTGLDLALVLVAGKHGGA